MSEPSRFQQQGPRAVLNLAAVEPGARVRLAGDAIAEVIVNPRDGAWLQVRYLTAADPSLVDTEELVFADDVLEVLAGA